MSGPSTNPYTTQSASGYNASPPADDGSAVAANLVSWANLRTKLTDVLKTFIETVNSAIVTMGTKVINTDAGVKNSVAGSIGFDDSELTIATGAVTPTRSYHTIDTQGDASTDDLDTLTTGSVDADCILIIRANHTDRTVVVKHNTGNIKTADALDYSLDDDQKSIVLQLRGATWYELARDAHAVVATQAQQEAGSVTTAYVSPGRQQFHPSAAKAWVMFNGTPSPAVNVVAYNCDQLTDTATGRYTVNFTTDFSGANYCGVGMAGYQEAGDYNVVATEGAGAAGTIAINTVHQSGGTPTLVDMEYVACAFFGDQ